MTAQENRPSLWATLPVSLRAIIAGIVIALVPADVWPLLLVSVGVPVAASVEVVFLGFISGGRVAEDLRTGRVLLVVALFGALGSQPRNVFGV